MALRKLTDATVEPVTLAEAKAHLNIFEASRDAYITALITTARTHCEEQLQRTLIDTTYELTLDAFPSAIPLRRPRVRTVTHVKYFDLNGVLQTLNPVSYQVDNKSEPGWIVPAYATEWPSSRDMVNALEVVYVCGYGPDASTVPTPIKQWVLLMLSTMFELRETEIASPGIASAEMKYADRLLDTYRIWA